MGIIGAIRGKIDELDQTYNPLRKVGDAISGASAPDTSGSTPEQKAYESKEKSANKDNPSYPGNVPTQTVDDSVKRMP